MSKIICGDAIEEMKRLSDNSVDLIVTDPPYNSKIVEWDNKDDEWQFLWLNEAKRVLKDGGSFYMFFAPMNSYFVEGWIRENLTLKNIIVWHHANLYGAGMSYGKDRYKSTWDVVFYATKGEKSKCKKNVSGIAYLETGRGFDVMIEPQPRPLLHKAQKPLKLFERFIICSSNGGDTVLDPFVGVGTALIACEKLKRNGIGIDFDANSIEITKERLSHLENLKEFDKTLWKQKKEKERIIEEDLSGKLIEKGT